MVVPLFVLRGQGSRIERQSSRQASCFSGGALTGDPLELASYGDRSPEVVDLAAVADAEDKDQESVVFDLVDDAVVAGADSPLPGAANKASCRWWSGFGSQKLKCSLDTSAHLGVELAELARGGGRQGYAVGHVRPRSALTCSHGIGASPGPVSASCIAGSLTQSDVAGHLVRNYGQKVGGSNLSGRALLRQTTRPLSSRNAVGGLCRVES